MANEKNRELFERMDVPKAVRAMAVPAIISQLIILFYNMADTFFVGRTNNPYMVAGASLILPVFNILVALSQLTGVGGGALISRLMGEGRDEEARRVCSFGLYLSAAIAVSFSLGVFLFMDPLMRLLGASPETYAFARSYAFLVIVLGGLPTILTNVLANFVRSVGDSRRAGFGVTMGGIINTILDPIFMFVLFPRGSEIIGAGVATCLSNCISCGYFLLTVHRMSRHSVLGLAPSPALPQQSSIAKLLTIGIPSSVSALLFDLDYIVIGRLMSAHSDIAMAAIGIVLKAERLPLNIGIGICQGMVPIVAYNLASGNTKRMRAVARYSLKLGICCGLVSLALYEAFAPFIMRFFIADAQTVALGTNFLRIRSLATILMFMSFYHVHLFNGYVRGQEALFLGVMRWAVFNIPMLFLLNAIFGMYGIAWAQLTADIFTVALSLFVHKRFLRQNGLDKI